jgi:hypothetical protein
MKRFPTVIALIAVSSAGMAQSITLRLNLPVGRSFAYAVTTKIKSEGGMAVANGSVSQSMTTTMKVLSKNARGTRVQTKITGVKITTDGKGMMAQQMSQAAKALEGSVTESVYDSRAQIVSATEGPRVMSMGGMGVGFLGVLYPSGSVAPGAIWRSEVDFQKIFSAMGQGMIQTGKNKTVPIRFKLVRVQRLGTRTLAHLSYEMKGHFRRGCGKRIAARGQIRRNNKSLDLWDDDSADDQHHLSAEIAEDKKIIGDRKCGPRFRLPG